MNNILGQFPQSLLPRSLLRALDVNHSIHACTWIFRLFYILICYEISTLVDTIIQFGVGGCVISISYKVECLDKERRYKNSTKEVILLFYLTFALQTTKC